jgi:hypothetical protein
MSRRDMMKVVERKGLDEQKKTRQINKQCGVRDGIRREEMMRSSRRRRRRKERQTKYYIHQSTVSTRMSLKHPILK